MRAIELPQPMTAEAIVDAGHKFVKDDYHELMLTGAIAMIGVELGHWFYLTGWNSSTAWKNPEATYDTLVVDREGVVSER